MFHISNARVEFYGFSVNIAYIVAEMKDQSYETIMKLGRGRMYDSVATSALKYNLPNRLLVMLRTG